MEGLIKNTEENVAKLKVKIQELKSQVGEMLTKSFAIIGVFAGGYWMATSINKD